MEKITSVTCADGCLVDKGEEKDKTKEEGTRYLLAL